MDLPTFVNTPIGYEVLTWFGSVAAQNALTNATNAGTSDSTINSATRIKGLFDMTATPQDVEYWQKMDQVIYAVNNICVRGPDYNNQYHTGLMFVKTAAQTYKPKYVVEMCTQTDISKFDDFDVSDYNINSSMVIFDLDSGQRMLWDGMTQNVYAAMPVKSYNIGVSGYPVVTSTVNNLSVIQGNMFYLFVQAILKAIADRGYVGTVQSFLSDITSKKQLPVFIVVDQAQGYVL